MTGYPFDLGTIDLPQLKEFYTTYYQPSNAALVLVGDFEINATLALIKKYYDKIPSKPKPKRAIP